MLDLLYRIDYSNKISYIFIDTGLEMKASKEHISFLEDKYGIHIERIKPEKPLPIAIKEVGYPFLTKHCSQMMSRAKKHGFDYKEDYDKPLEELIGKYPRAKSACKWYCDTYNRSTIYDSPSQFSIHRHPYLKEFLRDNPPTIPISDKCCDLCKKAPSKKYCKDNDIQIVCTGVRKAEGGVRASRKECFLFKSKGLSLFSPILWFTESDKKEYEKIFGIEHSEAYTKYGFKRTGCCGCPFNSKALSELDTLEKVEPNLVKAAKSIFGEVYEYERQYYEYREKCKKEKRLKQKQEK